MEASRWALALRGNQGELSDERALPGCRLGSTWVPVPHRGKVGHSGEPISPHCPRMPQAAVWHSGQQRAATWSNRDLWVLARLVSFPPECPRVPTFELRVHPLTAQPRLPCGEVASGHVTAARFKSHQDLRAGVLGNRALAIRSSSLPSRIASNW